MTMFSDIQALIIDLDGTMLDTAPDFLLAINRMRAEFALAPISLNMIKTMVGKGSEHLIQQVLALDFDAEQSRQHFTAAMDSYQRHYLAINGDQATLYPDVIAGLQAMHTQGLRLACVTNKPLAFARPLMEKKGLSGYFEVIFAAILFHVKTRPHAIVRGLQVI